MYSACTIWTTLIISRSTSGKKMRHQSIRPIRAECPLETQKRSTHGNLTFSHNEGGGGTWCPINSIYIAPPYYNFLGTHLVPSTADSIKQWRLSWPRVVNACGRCPASEIRVQLSPPLDDPRQVRSAIWDIHRRWACSLAKTRHGALAYAFSCQDSNLSRWAFFLFFAFAAHIRGVLGVNS
jgi:hypothetical protein